MNNLTLFMILVFALLTSSCVQSTNFEAVLDEHREASSETYKDCGVFEVQNICRQTLSTPENCLLEAFLTCNAAELRISGFSTEGEPVPQHAFVDINEDETCQLTVFTNHKSDTSPNAPSGIRQEQCSTLEQASVPEVQNCVFLNYSSCALVEQWD